MRPRSGSKRKADYQVLVVMLRGLIRAMGFNPTWELFIASEGWRLLHQKLSKEARQEIESIWRDFDGGAMIEVEA